MLRLLRQSAAVRTAARCHVLHQVTMLGVRALSKKGLSVRPATRGPVALEMFRPLAGESLIKPLFSALQRKRKHGKLPPLLRGPYLLAQAEALGLQEDGRAREQVAAPAIRLECRCHDYRLNRHTKVSLSNVSYWAVTRDARPVLASRMIRADSALKKVRASRKRITLPFRSVHKRHARSSEWIQRQNFTS